MIEFKNVTKEFKDKVVLSDISMEIEDKRLTVLIGPSGCGKTTTLKMINRLIHPTAGDIFIDGENIDELDPVKLRRRMGYVIQQIIYEYAKDQIEFDDIEDPLPYDIEAPLVEIEDQNYAIWYTDINEEEDKYYGKTLKIKGRSLLGGGLDDDEFVIGRHIMTCCVEDIQFGGLVAKYDRAEELEHGGWVEMTAVVKKEFNHMYQSEGPVLYAVSVKQTEPPEEEVATFY